jgi:5-(carboxyamino)imidazole ribonucleotide mutase
MSDNRPLVSVLMGSPSDLETMQACSDMLAELGVAHECHAISAHRQPEALHTHIKDAEKRGVKVFIGAAGGAAHLCGVIASITALPVLGVPMKGWATEGMDSLLSMVQMPAGVPVGTLAVGKPGAKNAAILAAQILGLSDAAIAGNVLAFRKKQSEGAKVLKQA